MLTVALNGTLFLEFCIRQLLLCTPHVLMLNETGVLHQNYLKMFVSQYKERPISNASCSKNATRLRGKNQLPQ